jgi:transcriptional regulator with XRE-family HTH domain
MKIYWSKEEGTKNIIGNKIKTLRKAAGLTQKQLAAKLQLQGHEFSDLTILRIEQGTRFVPDYEIVILADYFGITTDELLKDTQTKKV